MRRAQAGQSPQPHRDRISVALGVVYHSGLADLERCIASAVQSAGVRTIVLDASPSGEARVVAERLGVSWLDGSRNGGYAWGFTQVAASALDSGTDVLILSNSDVTYDSGCLQRLARHAWKAGGACYPVQLLTDNQPAYFSVLSQLSPRDAAARWLGLGRASKKRRTAATIERAVKDAEPTLIPPDQCGSGAVIAAPVDVWRSTGGLDTQFFLFEEDRTFGMKLQRLGIPALLCGDCTVHHEGGVRTRSPDTGILLEGVISERLAWDGYTKWPLWVLQAIQALGLAGRIFGYLVAGDRPMAMVTARVARAYWTLSRSGLGDLYEPDGYRRLAHDRLMPFG